MKLSARSRYAARILLELARNKQGVPVSATVLSQRTGVSAQFVEQILKPLKQHGLTNSVRGASGGHMLAKSPQTITLGEIIRLMEGGIQLSVCCKDEADSCERIPTCLIRNAWMNVSDTLQSELDAISLDNLLQSEARESQRTASAGIGKDGSDDTRRVRTAAKRRIKGPIRPRR